MVASAPKARGEEPDLNLRCSVWTRAQGVDPIGSAGTYSGYVLFEWPLPWPRDIGEIPELGALANLAASAGLRLQGLVPRRAQPMARLAVYRTPEDFGVGFAGYAIDEAEIRSRDGAEAAKALAALLSSPPGKPGQGVSEILLCTHGRRDRCCGSAGTALFADASAMFAERERSATSGLPALWRTSHTGGHRFAPTALLLPEGSAWAFLDTEALSVILARSGDPAGILTRYRGCSGLGSPSLQVLERAVVGTMGWSVLGAPRLGEDPGNGRVRLTVGRGSASASTWAGKVDKGPTWPVPECGMPLTSAVKGATELVLTDFERVS